MKSMYNPAEYPQGVPNPYTPAVHPYPSFQHGPDYTRPVFGMPYVRQPFNVLAGVGQAESSGPGFGWGVVVGLVFGAMTYPVLYAWLAERQQR